MIQPLLSVYFRSLVQQLPQVKCADVIDVLTDFRLKDRLTRPKRQEAHHDVQKVLSVPMAVLCEVATVAWEMAERDCEVRCLPHEFHAMQSTVCTNKTKS